MKLINCDHLFDSKEIIEDYSKIKIFMPHIDSYFQVTPSAQDKEISWSKLFAENIYEWFNFDYQPYDKENVEFSDMKYNAKSSFEIKKYNNKFIICICEITYSNMQNRMSLKEFYVLLSRHKDVWRDKNHVRFSKKENNFCRLDKNSNGMIVEKCKDRERPIEFFLEL